MATPLHKTTAPGFMKFTILVDPSLVIITTYLVCMIFMYLGVEKKIFKRNNAFSLFDLCDHALAQKPLSPGVMKFTILVDPSLVIIIIYLVCLICAWEQRRFLKK